MTTSLEQIRAAFDRNDAPHPTECPRLIDWDRAPWNRWAFRNIARFLPTAGIAAAPVPRALPEALRDIGGLIVDEDDAPVTLTSFLEQSYTDGFIVLKDGAILYEHYDEGVDAATPHLIQSVSKSIVATVVACLEADGLLAWDQPVVDILPELAAGGWADATLRDVMDMKSGVRYTEDYDDLASDMGITDYAAGWKPAPAGFDVSAWPQTLFAQVKSLKVKDRAAGDCFHYASIETEVLGALIERVTGQRLPEEISRRIWAPIGAEHAASIIIDRDGTGTASGGISCTLRDLARFGLALCGGGRVAGQQAIPRAFINDLTSGSASPVGPDYEAVMPGAGYRSQFWLLDRAQGPILCLGVFGQALMVDPRQGVVIAKQSSWPEFIDQDLAGRTDRIMAEVAAALA